MSQIRINELNWSISKNRKLSFSHDGLAYFYTITQMGNRAELMIASECACNNKKQTIQFDTLNDAKQYAYEHLSAIIQPLVVN